VEKTLPFYSPFLNTAVRQKDTTSLLALIDYFDNDRQMGWNLMQFGDYCGNLRLAAKAGYFYDLAIRKTLASEMQLPFGPSNLSHLYSAMTFTIYRPDRKSPGEQRVAWP
jgi:hypothetical protein